MGRDGFVYFASARVPNVPASQVRARGVPLGLGLRQYARLLGVHYWFGDIQAVTTSGRITFALSQNLNDVASPPDSAEITENPGFFALASWGWHINGTPADSEMTLDSLPLTIPLYGMAVVDSVVAWMHSSVGGEKDFLVELWYTKHAMSQAETVWMNERAASFGVQ